MFGVGVMLWNTPAGAPLMIVGGVLVVADIVDNLVFAPEEAVEPIEERNQHIDDLIDEGLDACKTGD